MIGTLIGLLLGGALGWGIGSYQGFRDGYQEGAVETTKLIQGLLSRNPTMTLLAALMGVTRDVVKAGGGEVFPSDSSSSTSDSPSSGSAT